MICICCLCNVFCWSFIGYLHCLVWVYAFVIAVFCVFNEKQKILIPFRNQDSVCWEWYHQESNRGHKDFQSFALPTELWHHRYCLFAGAKIGVFCDSRKFFRIFLEKNARVSENCSIFAPAIRDLAQLVAHYVRDVGVAGSSPVIPTVSGKR